jgi:hypothetical protein
LRTLTAASAVDRANPRERPLSRIWRIAQARREMLRSGYGALA